MDGITSPSCGMALQKGTRFCTNCGMKLEQIADQTTTSSPKQRVCPSCGMEMRDDVLYKLRDQAGQDGGRRGGKNETEISKYMFLLWKRDKTGRNLLY